MATTQNKLINNVFIIYSFNIERVSYNKIINLS